MNSIPMPKQTLAGFALAAFALSLGVYFGTKLGGVEADRFLLRLFYFLAVIAVLKAVFIWGGARGFPVRRKDGRLHFAHVVRNLVMAMIVAPVLLIFAAPLVMVAFHLAR